jgi:predicted histone-like DNA-binding protein
MIYFKAVSRKNPITKAEKWYPQLVSGAPMQLNDIVERISRTCTVTEHDVKAVVSSLQEQVIFALREGRSVRLGDLGSFRLTLAGEGTDTADELKAAHISHLRVRFSRSGRLRSDLRIGNSSIRFSKMADTGETGGLDPEE